MTSEQLHIYVECVFSSKPNLQKLLESTIYSTPIVNESHRIHVLYEFVNAGGIADELHGEVPNIQFDDNHSCMLVQTSDGFIAYRYYFEYPLLSELK